MESLVSLFAAAEGEMGDFPPLHETSTSDLVSLDRRKKGKVSGSTPSDAEL